MYFFLYFLYYVFFDGDVSETVQFSAAPTVLTNFHFGKKQK